MLSISYRLMKDGQADLVLSERDYVRYYERANRVIFLRLKDVNKAEVARWWRSLGYTIRLRLRGTWI